MRLKKTITGRTNHFWRAGSIALMGCALALPLLVLGPTVFWPTVFWPTVHAEELEELSERPEPSVNLGEAAIVYSEGLARVPVKVANASQTDGLNLLIEYDPELIVYSFWDSSVGDWTVEVADTSARGRVTVQLRPPRFVRGGRTPNESTVATVLVFGVVSGPDPASPFRRTSPLALLDENSRAGTHFFQEDRFRDTVVPGDLDGGSVSVYYESGFELGSVVVNPTRVKFAVPLYFTFLEGGHPAAHVGGMDYDELLMRGVQWFAPPVAKIRVEPRIGGVPGHARFEVEFAPEIRGPVARVHLGDVEFTYQDTHQTGDMIEIVPRLYPTWEAAGQGETDAGAGDAGAGDAGAGGDGAAEAGALGEAEAPLGSLGDVGGVGVVRVLSADPIRFLRGNVTSQVGGLDISAAQRILSFLYLGGNRLPCERAADLNGNNLVDQGDALWLLHMLFHNGPDPVAGPYPEPGFEPAAASPLSCDVPFPYFAPLAEDEE